MGSPRTWSRPTLSFRKLQNKFWNDLDLGISEASLSGREPSHDSDVTCVPLSPINDNRTFFYNLLKLMTGKHQISTSLAFYMICGGFPSQRLTNAEKMYMS